MVSFELSYAEYSVVLFKAALLDQVELGTQSTFSLRFGWVFTRNKCSFLQAEIANLTLINNLG